MAGDASAGSNLCAVHRGAGVCPRPSRPRLASPAFAEAATIGGFADWYAVVALFRRPLGLPIPHTAIIPANQSRIADNLGRFIEVNFLAPGPVRAKLAEVDFAARWSPTGWPIPVGQGGLASFVAAAGAQTISAMKFYGLRDFITQRVLDAARQGRTLSRRSLPNCSPRVHGRSACHQKLFDELIGALGKFLNDGG